MWCSPAACNHLLLKRRLNQCLKSKVQQMDVDQPCYGARIWYHGDSNAPCKEGQVVERLTGFHTSPPVQAIL